MSVEGTIIQWVSFIYLTSSRLHYKGIIKASKLPKLQTAAETRGKADTTDWVLTTFIPEASFMIPKPLLLVPKLVQGGNYVFLPRLSIAFAL